MSDWHYCRTTGADGGVDAVEGRAYGLDLESVLKDGLPPFKIALEVIAAMCEILDIAEQDDEGHGDLVPQDVYIDELDAHCEVARKAGATIVAEPEDMFWGDRTYVATDPEGHRWTFAQPIAN